MRKNLKLKRLCTQCAYFVPNGKVCKINPTLCRGRNGNACNDWKYKYRLDGDFVCEKDNLTKTSDDCECCVVRCIRSESRKEVDYALQ